MIKLLIIYFVLGLAYACIQCYIKEERRLRGHHNGWPIFLFSLIGAGWNALLNGPQE